MVSEAARRRGVELFNAREFYECHEVLEDVWRPLEGEERFFLQALIHFAVGFYHHEQGNREGAERQLRKALRKLAGYLPEFGGIDTGRLYREGQTALDTILSGGRLKHYPTFVSSATVSM
jgi:predicted metal-dependent hydrolase